DGPYEVLLDTASLLEGVTFPLYEPTADERRGQVERALGWFWLDMIDLAKRLARGHLSAAQGALASMRERAQLLAAVVTAAGVDPVPLNERLLASFVLADARAIAAAAEDLGALH